MIDVSRTPGEPPSGSVWLASGPIEERARPGPLPERVGVCVIGAGVAGLTTACCLAREGKEVLVLDARRPGSGETGLSSAHLASALDDRFVELERLHGLEGARLAAGSHEAAIDWIERTVHAEGIECGFARRDGWLFLGPDQRRDLLEQELVAARRAGLEVELHEQGPLPTLGPGPLLRFARQAQVDPLRYLAGLARAFERLGGRIHHGVRAEGIEGGSPAAVLLPGGRRLYADAVVVATNSPVHLRVQLHTKQAAYRTYVVGLEVPRDPALEALFWDTTDPYHYVRLAGVDAAPGLDLLLVGGEDHKTGQALHPERRWSLLEDWARSRFPSAGPLRWRWSGQVLEPVDGLGFIGRSPDRAGNVYLATGDSGHGMTHGTIAGLLLTDLILGRPNPWEHLYDPRRRTLSAGRTWLGENLNVAAHYLDWVASEAVRAPGQLAPGEGTVMSSGLQRLAVHRDEQGEYQVLSARCPHLGGMVHWNAAEKSWDCPLHGSRFDACGRPLNGPANRGLGRVEPGRLLPLIEPAAAEREEPRASA